MIEFAQKHDFSDIIRLWHEVFGDDEAVIESFLKRFHDRVLVYRMDGKICGMLSLLPISVKRKTGYYVYAVATSSEYRSQGIATKLLDYAKSLCGEEKFLILVPATPALFEFYKKKGFLEISCVTKNISGDLLSDVYIPVTPISATEYLICRKEYFSDRGFFEWDIDVLSLMHDCFGMRFLRLGEEAGFAACDIFEDMVNIKEICLNSVDIDVALSSVCRFFGKGLYSYTIPKSSTEPSAMVWGVRAKKPYFNLALD